MGMLTIANGDFRVSNELMIRKAIRYDESLKMISKYTTRDVQNGYKWIYIEDILIDGLIFNFGLCFYKDVIESINFTFRGKYEKAFTWEDYSLEKEKRNKKEYEKWLRRIVGDTREFDWGTVGVYFDSRDETVSLHLHYKK